MSRKRSIVIISIIVLVSLIISVYIPNREIIEENEDTSIVYSIMEENGKIGVTDGVNMIIQPQYDEIIIPNEHRAVFMCRNDEKRKFVNYENKEIFKDFEDVDLIHIHDSIYEKNILVYEKNGKYGLLGINGKIVTEARYEEVFSSGYKDAEVIVKENGKYGIIDEKGNAKIKSSYDSIRLDEYYTETYGYKKSGYIVQQTTSNGYRYGYYDCDGVQVLKEEYNQINRLTQIESNDIYLIAAKNGQYGVFINNSKIINTQYQQIEYNSDLEIFIVERTGKYGIMNLKGVECLKAEFEEIQINGIYIYTVNGQEKKVWDTNGKEVDISFDTIIQKTNSQYFIKSDAGNFSILDSNFETMTKQNYKYLEFAFDSFFIATNEQDKCGVVDLEENIILDFKYDVIQLIKDENKLQAIDFANNRTDYYDENISLIKE